MNMTVREVIQSEIERRDLGVMDSMADELKLWEWAKWGSTTGNNLSYPRCLLPFAAKGWFEKTLRRVVGDISDDEAMRIDRAVTTLPQQHKTVIVAIYRMQVPHRRLAAVIQISGRKVDSLHHQALGMLWAELRAAKRA